MIDHTKDMKQVTLTRIAPARNMARYYHLAVEPDLFGSWCCIRVWGRLGTSGQLRSVPYPSAEAAQTAFTRLQRGKECKGYVPRPG